MTHPRWHSDCFSPSDQSHDGKCFSSCNCHFLWKWNSGYRYWFLIDLMHSMKSVTRSLTSLLRGCRCWRWLYQMGTKPNRDANCISQSCHLGTALRGHRWSRDYDLSARGHIDVAKCSSTRDWCLMVLRVSSCPRDPAFSSCTHGQPPVEVLH